MTKLKQTIIRFENELHHNELPKFRGAIIQSMENAPVLFHNHQQEGLRYAYPLIQYKTIHKKVAIVCIGSATESIEEFFSTESLDVQIGKSYIKLCIESIETKYQKIQVGDEQQSYRIRRWLPLNQDNYRQYNEMESIVDKYKRLEEILIGNLLSFAKGIGLHIEKHIICKISSVDNMYLSDYKGVKMMSFDVAFKTNVIIPDYIGLGKGTSIGFGNVKTSKKHK